MLIHVYYKVQTARNQIQVRICVRFFESARCCQIWSFHSEFACSLAAGTVKASC